MMYPPENISFATSIKVLLGNGGLSSQKSETILAVGYIGTKSVTGQGGKTNNHLVRDIQAYFDY